MSDANPVWRQLTIDKNLIIYLVPNNYKSGSIEVSYNYNILRTKKVKNRQGITTAAEHNLRLRTQSNIDTTKSHLNEVLINSLNASTTDAPDLQKKLTEYYKKLGIKEKANNVPMLEWVVSASPEFFKGKSPIEVKQWANDQLKFFRAEFGDQLKFAILHLDEKTPHIHFMVSTEQNAVKKYKNQFGEFFKEGWSLNARRYDPEFLRGLHDRHAEHNKKHGLKRGVKGSMRKHKSLKEFYAIVDKALGANYEKQIEKVVETLETGLISGKVTIAEIREKFAPMMNTLIKQNKALKEKYSLDIKGWATDLQAQADQLKTRETALEEAKKHQDNSLRKRLELDSQLKEAREKNKKLEDELAEVKKKLPAESTHTPTKNKEQRYGKF